MREWIEIRDGKRYKVTRLPDTTSRPHKSAQPKRRRDPGKYPFTPTKFPFAATINGKPVIVWPDWIEREEADA